VVLGREGPGARKMKRATFMLKVIASSVALSTQTSPSVDPAIRRDLVRPLILFHIAAPRPPRACRLVKGIETLRTLPIFGEGIHWTSAIRPGQYSAFLRDRDTSVALDTSVTIFDSLNEARAWGEEVCACNARTRCDIYDSEGLANNAVDSIYNAAVRGDYVGVKPARTRLFAGLAALSVGTVLIAWDFHRDFRFMWGYILGVKLVLIGTTAAIQGASMLRRC
jgi:hypothetical protein